MSEKRIYLNYNLNRNEIRNIVIENNLQENYVQIWTENTQYYTSNKIYLQSNKKFYICNIQHTSSNDFVSDISNWSEITSVTLKTLPNINNKGLLFFDSYINRLKSWNGTSFKTVSYIEDLYIKELDNVALENIWVDSEEIPTTEVDALSSTFVFKHINIESTHIPNTEMFSIDIETAATNQFVYHKNGTKRLAINNIVPEHYAPNDLYKPILTTYNGIIIEDEWFIKNNTIILKNGFINNGNIVVNASFRPKLTFYEYIGKRLTFSLLGGGKITKIQCNNGITTNTNFVIPITGNIFNTQQIKEITINGIIMYDGYDVTDVNELTIDLTILGWQLTDDDYIYIYT